jgi:uncharacterized membrane protein
LGYNIASPKKQKIMAETLQSGSLVPTQDERVMATMAHALQLFLSWIAPLVIFLTHRNSRFVSFHAMQALLLQILQTIVIVVCFVGWFILMFTTLFVSGASKPAGNPPVGLFLVFPILWLLLMGTWITGFIIVIVYAVKANRGEWAEYPVVGKLARKLLKMGPGGSGI